MPFMIFPGLNLCEICLTFRYRKKEILPNRVIYAFSTVRDQNSRGKPSCCLLDKTHCIFVIPFLQFRQQNSQGKTSWFLKRNKLWETNTKSYVTISSHEFLKFCALTYNEAFHDSLQLNIECEISIKSSVFKTKEYCLGAVGRGPKLLWISNSSNNWNGKLGRWLCYLSSVVTHSLARVAPSWT